MLLAALSFALAAVAPAASLPNMIAPALIFVLAATAAVGLILLLPGRLESPIPKIGGAVLIAVGIILAAVLGKSAAGVGAYFWIFSAIAVFCAVRVITHPRPVYSALYFVMTVMASAGLFVLMWAEFMAAALVIIYAGAILVTYVFVIMLASQATPAGATPMHEQMAEYDAMSREPIAASAVGFALLGILLFVIFDKSAPIAIKREGASETAAQLAATTVPPTQAAAPTTQGFQPHGATQLLGHYLFTSQLVNLELAGLLLTVAMVGAIVIARKRVVGPSGAVDTSRAEVLTAPATPVDDNPHSIPVVGTDNPRQKEYPET
jgi:NADH-quinone oxidoreductase subunit J